MVNYFVKVISRRPSTTRYQWLYKIVQCIVKREPTNNRILRIWVQKAIRGRKDRNYKIPACVRHLWKGRLTQKPTYHDLASLVRFAFYNKRITYRGLYLFTWSVLNEDKPAVVSGHTDFWNKYAGVRSAYVSGLKLNTKFLIITGTKKIVLGEKIQKFTKLTPNSYWFFDDNKKAIRWIGNHRMHLGVVGGLREGSRVRLVRGKNVRRQDQFVYSSVDMKFHNYVKKDLCITFRNPNNNGERMTLGRCSCKQGNPASQELLVKYFKFDTNNGFKPYEVFTLRNAADKKMGLKISNDGSLLLPSQRYAKVVYGARNQDDEKFFWDPTTKCLRNYLYREGCVGTVQQGCGTQMVSLGKSEDAGRSCADAKFDGSFLWINGKVVQPQAGYMRTNNIHISLNDVTGEHSQRWILQKSGINAKSTRSRQRQANADGSWGWPAGSRSFELRATGNKVVTAAANGRVYLRSRTGAADQIFFFDARTKTIQSRKFRGFALTSVKSGKDRYTVVS